ncbi:protein FAR1-RELATED SEQUENCE 5-like [Diospyros lotus]|uniref:protein FAR1-RELATED SEQUENCE 5-like n=1 Tax=Diospyros lotus TaxID=55363 RepID=UPI0022578484|nr:protein FAR1-RELATED SEQUENCE 5-like [Diospyros lotus]
MSTTQRSESINTFFDGYVHSKTSLKQFVEQYERALRCKVEKEFQADFKSFSQMVLCATKYAIEKQFQEMYTISKFREFQEEFIGKVYCEVVSSNMGGLMPRYDVQEDVMLDGRVRKEMFTVLFQRETTEFVCSCHLFEFRGIVFRHAISVLLRNDVIVLPKRYILMRWRRDVSRRHTRVAVNYDGWINTHAQVRFDKMCNAFTNIANLAADDENQVCGIMEWIESKTTQLSMSQPIHGGGSNLDSQASVQVAFNSLSTELVGNANMLDLIYSRTKGAPKKLRKKSQLEKNSKKSKTVASTDRGKTKV